tara:strand:- start:133 stop:654 length:522 start_codon:yes stop_codon:yes gene_type:complete
MARPKSSVIGFVDLGISALNTKKISKIDKSIGALSASLYSSNLRIESNLEDIRKAQIASLYGMAELHSSLQKLDLTQNEILQELKRQDKEEDVLGNLKIFLIQIEDELERILLMSESHLEYSVMLAEDLKKSLSDNDINIGRFKRLSRDDIKWAKSVIENVSETASNLYNRLV